MRCMSRRTREGRVLGARCSRDWSTRRGRGPRVDRINLTVVETETVARRLYAAAGFQEFGRESDGLRQDGVGDTVLYLALELTRIRALS